MKDTGIKLPNNKEFFKMQSQEFQDAFLFYTSLVSPTSPSDPIPSSEEVTAALSSWLSTNYGFTPSAAKSCAAHLQAQFSLPETRAALLDSPPHPLSPEKPKITVSLEDYQKFMEMVQGDPEATPQIKALLLSFIIFYRRNYHPTGWVRYDKKNIFYLAGISKISTARQEKLTTYLHNHYDLNMQVIGSNQPIPCYNLSWLQAQPLPGSASNPMITLGDLAPETVKTIVSKLNP